MKWHMRFSEFIRIGDNVFEPDIPTTDKIIKNFMVPLNEIREELEQPIYIRSCFRPEAWERLQGRPLTSQHLFNGEGACDVSLTPTTDKGSLGWRDLFKALDSKYNRICWYPKERFFHVDFKTHAKNYFIYNDGWEYVSREKLLEAIPD